MADFMTHFILCNILISCFIGILLTARHMFQNVLTSRMQYHLWFLLLGLLAVPFIPLKRTGFTQFFAWPGILRNPSAPDKSAVNKAVGTSLAAASDWMNDFAISVNSQTASAAGALLFGIWVTGIIVMILLTVRSSLCLRTLKKSALDSAIQASVNWYFQAMDARLGAECISKYLQKIRYGNRDMSSGLSAYWLEASLRISPIEQVQLLTDFYNNRFGFAQENIAAVKNALRLPSAASGALYGKTGTGNIEGQNVNGWFIGYSETSDNTYFFASNIHADEDASGSRAAEITMSILSDFNGEYSTRYFRQRKAQEGASLTDRIPLRVRQRSCL